MRKRFDMPFYICCTQENNDCPKKEECRRYLNANEGTSWALFKYMCTEENDYHLFMEKENKEDKDDNIKNNKEENNIDE